MFSPLQKARLAYKPKVPKMLTQISQLELLVEKPLAPLGDAKRLKALFPHLFSQPLIRFKKAKKRRKVAPLKIGAVFSGGQAAGGHNVLLGLFDALQSFHTKSKLIGFLDGPKGIIDNKTLALSKKLLDGYRNMGGFDLLGSGRTKIEKPEEFKACLQNVKTLDLDGLVIIGGDDSNTNAALLAEYFQKNSCKTKVVGVPKTIDGDLRGSFVEMTFGFDTACKIYAEIIGNIATDALSAKKYYHFIKLMGRSASHVALECALKTHPNMAIIGEEVFQGKMTLSELTKQIAELIILRSKNKKNYGIILLPEGLIEFIPEIRLLIKELNTLVAETSPHCAKFNELKLKEKVQWVQQNLSQAAKLIFDQLPGLIQEQLLLERDPHGNVQVSLIETEKLFMETVKAYLKKDSSFKGKFSALHHFLGYEGRSAMPSNFDANYTYALGLSAALLISQGLTGYMATLCNLKKPPLDWSIVGVPLVSMMDLEDRKGKEKPVIRKALVDLKSKAFQTLAKQRTNWALEDSYLSPGPIQFFAKEEITDSVPLSL